MENLDLWKFALIAMGAFLIGLAKGGVPGVGNLTIILVATALPAKVSVGVLLPILIAGDVVAVVLYREHVLWPYIFKLMPSMLCGVVIGYFVFSRINDAQVQVLIGMILLGMTAVYFIRKWLRRGKPGVDKLPDHPLFIGFTGIIGGFATMVANAAGPVAALYFIASGLPKYAYISTLAWFFLLVNLFKVPFMIDLGILSSSSLTFSLQFILFAIVGALITPAIVKRIHQNVFEILIWVFVVIGGLKFLFP